jgi:hypothetical protein
MGGRAAELPLPGVPAPLAPLAIPDKRRRGGVPGDDRIFQPGDDRVRCLRMLPRQGAPHQNPLQRLGQIWSRPTEQCVQRHDSLLEQRARNDQLVCSPSLSQTRISRSRSKGSRDGWPSRGWARVGRSASGVVSADSVVRIALSSVWSHGWSTALVALHTPFACTQVPIVELFCTCTQVPIVELFCSGTTCTLSDTLCNGT